MMESFKLKAEECRQLVRLAQLEEHRQLLLEMAKSWEELARWAENRANSAQD